jgi:CRP-like cAMP-binding protein
MHDANDRHMIHNRLLSQMAPAEVTVIGPHLKLVEFTPPTLLARAGDIVHTCYFPNGGMVSLLCVTEQGRSVEAGFTGFEGMIGLSVLFGNKEMPYDALVQAPTSGYAIDAAVVRQVFKLGGAFHDAVLRFAYVVLKQMSQTCVCNHFHTIEARLCRWLTVMCERSNDRHLRLTQEFLAHMLGVQRTSVGPIANALQATGAIRYTRGRVEILDLDRVRALACDCYSVVSEEYRRFLADGGYEPMSDGRQTLSVV